jgi:sugar lactone lactonase YvrE
MNARRLTLATLASLCAVAALLALSAGVAQATFITAGVFGSSGSGNGQFGFFAPLGAAVDQSTGDVYLSDTFSKRVEKFDSQGRYLSQFGSSGSGSGQFGGAGGVAVDPSNADVYVADAGLARVEKFDPAGSFILMFGREVDKTRVEAVEAKLAKGETPTQKELEEENVCTAASGDTCGAGASGSGNGQFPAFFNWFGNVLGVGSSGDVYVAEGGNGRVEKFGSQGNYLSQITTHLSNPTAVAVDPTGNLYVADSGAGAVEKFDSSGVFVTAIGSGTSPTAVATDAAGDLFAFANAPVPEIIEYDPAGAQIDTIGANALGAGAANPGIAFGDTAERLYVAQPEGSDAWIFAPATAPTIGRELAVGVSISAAKLGAEIGPGGYDTSYYFEYGTTIAYGQTAPFPAGDAGAGLESRSVWATASGLAPGTTYHYRVVATNPLGTVLGADQTFTTQTAAQASCPNEQFRGGFSASLPDCRAYEQVTQANKASTQPDPFFGEEFFTENHASREGNRLSYFAVDVLPGSQSAGESYLATRGASGWSSENEIPAQSNDNGFECPIHGAKMPAYSADLSRGILIDGGNQNEQNAGNFGGDCGGPGPELVSGEPKGVANLFLRDNTNGTYRLIDVTPPGVTPANAPVNTDLGGFEGASSDLSHVVFVEAAKLTANAPSGGGLYEWAGGVVRLVTVLPNGAPVAGSPAASWETHAHVISADGSRIFFTAAGNLYVRENAEQPPTEECADPSKACTVQVDASPVGASGGGGQFMEASADGSEVFFTDDASAALTSDTVPGSGTNLYRYDLPSRLLTDVTPRTGAEVKGVSGVSEDGSYVYFVANGSLAPGAAVGDCKPEIIFSTIGCNLYLFHGGTTTFIATLSGREGAKDLCVVEYCRRVSSNGAFIAFASQKSLTGYDNTDANTGLPDAEIFLYDAGANKLVCASCNPSGEAPTGHRTFRPIMELRPGGAPHYLSDSGRLFFATTDALLPQDTNGKQDVYEFEPDGVGSCGDAGGCIYLISTGTSSLETGLIDVSASGNDVFLRQYQQLLPQDVQEEARTLVDARVGGGFPEPSAPPPCSTADSCRSAPSPQPSIFGAPASATFSGAGNLAPPVVPKPAVKPKSKPAKCKKGFVKKKGKCVKVKAKKRKAKRTAHANKGGK